MLAQSLLVYGELDHGLYEDLMDEYPTMPTFKQMVDEYKGYDLVELALLRRNYLTMKEYLYFGPRCCLDDQERDWCSLFIAGQLFALDYCVANTQLVHPVK